MTEGLDSKDLGETFRSALVEACAERASPIDSARIWSDLTAGRSKLVADFCVGEHSFLALRDNPSPSGRRSAARNLEILERILLGTEQKVVAIELGLACSTIAAALKQAFEFLGLRCMPSKVPLLLVMLVHAAKAQSPLTQTGGTVFDHAGVSYQALTAPMPERELNRLLSPAECAVVRMRLEGRSHAEIAARRRTSLRTVANQLATASQRLGVSGRSALMELLIGEPTLRPRNGRTAPDTPARHRTLHASRLAYARGFA